MFFRIGRGIVWFGCPKEHVHIKGKACGLVQHDTVHFLLFLIGQSCFRGDHHTIFLRDVFPVSVIILHKAGSVIPHISIICEVAGLTKSNIPAIGLIVDIVLQIIRHLHSAHFLYVVATQIVMV